MNRSLRTERENLALAIIDVQDGLMKAMEEQSARALTRNVQTLIGCAKEMGIPIVLTEQYPKGLGKTIGEIKKEIDSISPVEKTAFSCYRVDAFKQRLDASGRKEVILTGIETHICVLQTAADLIDHGYRVHVAADAVCSRRKLDWEIGLRWMERAGAMILTTEIIAFQLLKESGTDEFRRLARFFK